MLGWYQKIRAWVRHHRRGIHRYRASQRVLEITIKPVQRRKVLTFAVLSVNRSTVKNSDGISDFLRNLGLEPLSEFLMNVLSLLWSRYFASSNRPNWLVGDDNFRPVADVFLDLQIKSGNQVRQTLINCIWLKTTSSVLPASRSSSCSPMHGIILSPVFRAFLTFSPISSSDSPKTCRRSEWPRITQLTPRSLKSLIKKEFKETILTSRNQRKSRQ